MISVRHVAALLMFVLAGCGAHEPSAVRSSTVRSTALVSTVSAKRPPARPHVLISDEEVHGTQQVCDVATTCPTCIVDDLHELATRVCAHFDSPSANRYARLVACALPGADDPSKLFVMEVAMEQTGIQRCALADAIRARLH